MFEKLRIIFTIPELRQKILLTLGLLAIYRVGWQVPLPIVDPQAMTAFAEEAWNQRPTQNGGGVLCEPAVSGYDFWSGNHALHLGINHFPIIGHRLVALGAIAERGRGRSKKDQRIHALCDCGDLFGAELGLCSVFVVNESRRYAAHPTELSGGRQIAAGVATRGCDDDDGRYDFFDVAW